MNTQNYGTYLFTLKKIMTFGTHFSRNRHFHQTKKHNVEAMYNLFKCIQYLTIPIELQLYLFDQVILPVALYIMYIWL